MTDEEIMKVMEEVLTTNFLEDGNLQKYTGLEDLQIVALAEQSVDGVLKYIQSGKAGMPFLDKNGIEAIFMMGMCIGGKLHEIVMQQVQP